MSLVAALSDALPGGPRSWTDLVVVSNVGPAWDPRALSGNLPSNRGFNAALFGPDRRPTHYVKVRSAEHRGFRREANLTTRLSGSRETRELVPEAREVVTPHLRALALDWVSGPDLFERLRGAAEPARIEEVTAVLERMRPLSAAASSEDSDETDPFPDAESEVWVLREALGLERAVADRLLERLRETPLAAVRQHGDLWPRNLLRDPRGWQVIDFETFGAIDVPNYDLLHLLRGCAAPDGSFAGSDTWPGVFRWLGWWCSVLGEAPSGDALRQAVAEHVAGLGVDEVEASVVRYVVSLTARQRAKGDLRTSGALMHQVRALPTLLTSGVLRRAVAQLLPMPS